MQWLVLILAGVFEAFIPLLIIRSDTYTHLLYTPLLLIIIVASILCLRYAISRMPVSIAYTVWTACGILGTTLIGFLLLDEAMNMIKIFSLLLIVIAVAGLRVSTSQSLPQTISDTPSVKS